MTRICETCGNEFTPTDPRRPSRACSRHCRGKLAWAQRPAGTSYTKVYLPGHPLADERGAVGEHRVILYAKVGPDEHPCHWCGRTLRWLPTGQALRRGSLQVDHLDGNPRNNDPMNLVPSCTGCNTGRAQPNHIADGELFVLRGGKRVRAERHQCVRCSTEFLHRIAAAGPGLYCSKSCKSLDQQRANAITDGELFVTLPNGRRARAVERQCAKCGRTFLVRPIVVKNGGGRYCSKSCIDRRPGAKAR